MRRLAVLGVATRRVAALGFTVGVLAPSAAVRAQEAAAVRAEGAAAAVAAVLDELHAAASAADFERYFAVYADDAVFLGTDATERWPIDDFKEYARARFSEGRGWTYVVKERHVSLSEDGTTAWFDERLDNEHLGDTRGSGVLVRRDGAWKVAQYNLTIPIPNELADEVVARVREITARP